MFLPWKNLCRSLHQSHLSERIPGVPQVVESRTNAAMIGSKKHSVLPEPVPVVTTTSRAFTTDSSKTRCWCSYGSRFGENAPQTTNCESSSTSVGSQEP